MNETAIWISFNIFVIAMLALDFLWHGSAHEVKFKEAIKLSAFWIILALIFCFGIYFFQGSDPALNFLTGYLIEKSLSVDNLFVFLLIFSSLQVPKEYHHKVLLWGVLGALVMRAIFIFAGIILINKFHWIIYVFGIFLIFSGIKLFWKKEDELDPEEHFVLRIFRRFIPMTEKYEGDRFIVKRKGRYLATPLLMVLVLIETTDIIFAIDSVPAILAITTDPFIVYTSNVFAILGLRALYFALQGLMQLFHYLHYGLAVILIFVGSKMLFAEYIQISTLHALGTIAIILAISILASLIMRRN
jgi:tellurite resistance protein TerC